MSETASVPVETGSLDPSSDLSHVAIVLVNYNGTADTLKCLESIRRQSYQRILTVVVDNGSSPDESARIGSAHPWAVIIRREENGGWSGGNNEGINFALGRGVDWVLLLNNDTTVSSDLVDHLLSAAQRRPRCGIVGPIICFMDDPTEVMTDGCDFNPPGYMGFFRRHPIHPNPSDPLSITEVDIINGCCMMISAAVFRRIGLIDEQFFLIHEESDFCLRAQQAGFVCGLIAETLVWHKGSSSFKRTGNGLQRYFDARNLCLLLKKHQSTRERGKGPLKSWLGYLRYVYHRYSIERDHHQDQAADAVIEGFCDALAGRYGPRTHGRPMAMSVVRHLFKLGRRVRPSSIRN